MASTPLKIGLITRSWLNDVGIFTLEDLQAVGVVRAYQMIKHSYPRLVTLNALWGLEGLVSGTDWRALSPERKQELLSQLED